MSNCEDQLALHNFLAAVKKRIGSVTLHWFMSDDTEQIYTAWRSVFGEFNNRLLCSWHEDRGNML